MKPLGKAQLGLTDEENRYPKYAKGGIKNECVAFAEIGEEEYSGELNLIVMPKTFVTNLYIDMLYSIIRKKSRFIIKWIRQKVVEGNIK